MKLGEKINVTVKCWQNLEKKKKMFGGVCYLFKGNMAFGIYKDILIVHMDKEQGEQNLKDRNVWSFDIAEKAMTGWVMLMETGWNRQVELRKWIGVGKYYALSLPEKKGRKRATRTKTLKEYEA